LLDPLRGQLHHSGNVADRQTFTPSEIVYGRFQPRGCFFLSASRSFSRSRKFEELCLDGLWKVHLGNKVSLCGLSLGDPKTKCFAGPIQSLIDASTMGMTTGYGWHAGDPRSPVLISFKLYNEFSHRLPKQASRSR
jgi:hypothetical protein